MMLNGIDHYGGSDRKIDVSQNGAHVLLTIEEGAALITPGQARSLSRWLDKVAGDADENAELDWSADD